MKKILFITIVFLFFNCSDKSSIKVKEKTDTIAFENQLDENFSTFLEKFSKDSLFQISRVSFPMVVEELDDNYKSTNRTVFKKDYLCLDFLFNANNVQRATDHYDQKIKLLDNKVVIEIRGIANGIYTDFIFEKRKNEWFLITWIDGST